MPKIKINFCVKKRAGSQNISFFPSKEERYIMSLLEAFIFLLQLWRPAFSSKRSFNSAREYACAMIGAFGLKKTLSNVSISTGKLDEKPSAIYKFFSLLKWGPEDLFNPIIQNCLPWFKKGYIAIGVDDSKFKKTGKKIPNTSWHRDPMSPKFHVNLIWGLRFLQFSALVPLYDFFGAPCRAIPIRFIDAPPVKKPGKKASDKEREEYVQAKMTHSLSTIFVNHAKKLREYLNSIGQASLRIIFVCDGSFCNTVCLTMSMVGMDILARCKKNAVLCFAAQDEGRRQYSKNKFNPENVRQDESIPYRKGQFFYGGQHRAIRYKEVKNVLWQRVTKSLPLRLIVIAPIPYEHGGRKNYREPGYLLTTDLVTPVEELIQVYLDRLQIEYNFRDEKSVFGVGEAQVRNEKSVTREPAFTVAVYSALLLASIMSHGDRYSEERDLLPKWRKVPIRPSCRMLMKELYNELRNAPEKVIKLKLTEEMIHGIMRKVA